MIKRKNSRSPVIMGALCCGFVLAACGGTTGSTKRLVDARQAYDEARRTPGAELEQDELLEANKALRRAEAAHAEDPGSATEIHYAYIAERRAKIAAARAAEARALQEQREAERLYEERQAQLQQDLEKARQALMETREALREVRSALAATGGENRELMDKKRTLEEQQAQLEQTLMTERQARLDAEETAKAALASLERVAQVKAEEQETVITLGGSVLFPTGQSSLLPIAEDRLGTVAEALKQQDPSTQFVVEGHTDSRGSEETNQRLSMERAESVRQYLIGQGIEENRVRAVGKGESEPVTSNDTAEGRANNRRVEIVVSKGTEPSSGSSGQGQTMPMGGGSPQGGSMGPTPPAPQQGGSPTGGQTSP